MMKLSMVILLALFGAALSATNRQCKTCTESVKDGACQGETTTTCTKDTDKCYSITYNKTVTDTATTTENYKKGCATPLATAELDIAAATYGLDDTASTYAGIKAMWCDTDSCDDYSARLTCHKCGPVTVADVDTLCTPATNAVDFCGVKEQCASVFYMANNDAMDERKCMEFSEPKEWTCADNSTQSACGIKFCDTDKCEEYSSSISATIAVPLLLVAIVNAYF